MTSKTGQASQSLVAIASDNLHMDQQEVTENQMVDQHLTQLENL